MSKEWQITLLDNKGKDRMTIWSPRDQRCLHDFEDELADQDDVELESPNFAHKELDELKDRGYVRKNR